MKKSLTSIRKFYLLDYFYVLLKSVEKYTEKDQIFELFKSLKQEHGLGESKYRKLTADTENLTEVQLRKYQYTFEKVISESLEYELINQESGKLFLTNVGKQLIEEYNSGFENFNLSLFKLMESKYEAFKYIIDLMYESGKNRSGLFILPIYSPLQLGLNRSEIKNTNDIKNYSNFLVKKLEQDIQHYLGEYRNLSDVSYALIEILIKDKLISAKGSQNFLPLNYNAILSRFRDYWLKYFLNEIYHYEFYLSSFEIWTYRAKQIGIIHVTEFYPNFSGKIVYPTSVIVEKTNSIDFKNIFKYEDGRSLFLHQPDIQKNQDQFVDYLVSAYYTLRRTNRNYFISLAALRELVCYNMRISEYVFQEFLDSVYRANLLGNLKIKISLEVDRLPEETKATFLKQVPVLVDGRYRNIIAIDIADGGKR